MDWSNGSFLSKFVNMVQNWELEHLVFSMNYILPTFFHRIRSIWYAQRHGYKDKIYYKALRLGGRVFP